MKSLVIGGSASIGAAIVSAFHHDGHDVVATYRTAKPPNLDGAKWLHVDLANRKAGSDVAAAADGAKVAVFCPGLVLGQPLGQYSDEQIDEMVDVNFAGQVRVIRDISPVMADDSQIILIGSLAAQRGSDDPLYGATKGAIHALAKSLAKSLAPRIRVNVIAPGMVTETRMHDATPESVIEGRMKQTPTGHFISAGELAQIVLDLTKPHWRQVNGACIDINGGQYLR